MPRKKKNAEKRYVISPKKAEKKEEKFKRARHIRKLRTQGDPKWKDAARADLEDLAEDDSGARVLAAAIKALLRK